MCATSQSIFVCVAVDAWFWVITKDRATCNMFDETQRLVMCIKARLKARRANGESTALMGHASQ